MTLSFLIPAIILLLGAAAANVLRNLVHCVLALTLTFAGFALLYLGLGAEFLGLVQLLVYVGAIAILIVFTVLLTGGGVQGERHVLSPRWFQGFLLSGVVFLMLGYGITKSSFTTHAATSVDSYPVSLIGDRLMTNYSLPLEILGVLLTAATIGGVVLAIRETKQQTKESQ
jgi:NADH-quinone oxidoreductase subunit J